MGAKQPKIKKYDPAKYESKIQLMKQDLQKEINDKAVQTQQGALDASQEGINDLYNGIGLLSDYMRSRTDQTKVMGDVYAKGSGGLLSLSQGLKDQSAKIVDNFIGNYRS